MKKLLLPLLAVLLLLCGCGPKEHTLYFYATNDLHGAFFGEPSLSNVSAYVDSKRCEVGEKSVILLDVGDNLQGGNEVYYSNYKDTTGRKHLFTRVTEFIGYDAIALGNHDIEAGHPVYDKINGEISIPYLAANAIDVETGKPYFQPYAILKKGGVKVAVIGFENPNIDKWLSPALWEGIKFIPTYPLADSLVKAVRQEHNPDLVVIAVHGGIGSAQEHQVENPALYLASNVKGVDIVFSGHDHRRFAGKVFNGEDSVLVMDGGSKARQLSEVKISFKKKGGKVYDKEVCGSLIDMKGRPRNEKYDAYFAEDVAVVNDFVNQKVGEITEDLDFGLALEGMSPYMNFIHYVQLEATGADVSISAPLSTSGMVKKGDVLYKNLFDLYRYENQLYVIKMSGAELKNYLEASYDLWVRKAGPAYNYDSASGINYTVSKRAPKGKRVVISSMSNGEKFDPQKEYTVAMTSYRASGAGDLLKNAGIDLSEVDSRCVMRLPEIRELIYEHLQKMGSVTPSELSKNPRLGNWNFVK